MVNSPSIGISDFGVRDAGKVALRVEQRLLIGSVEIGPVDRAREISDEHPTAFQIQGQADALHQVGEHDFGRFAVARRSIERRAVYGAGSHGPSSTAYAWSDRYPDRSARAARHIAV